MMMMMMVVVVVVVMVMGEVVRMRVKEIESNIHSTKHNLLSVWCSWLLIYHSYSYLDCEVEYSLIWWWR